MIRNGILKPPSLGWKTISCPACNNTHVTLSLSDYSDSYGDYTDAHFAGKILRTWQIIPESTAKPQPDYIPLAIRQDYYEACLIQDKSPKASATLARRCLQGMIRDFWGIKGKTLNHEINELEEQQPGTKDLINPIRELGNIGAHMEQDVNLMIEVDADEAQLLIALLEDLFEEWYVTRHKRQERTRKLSEKVEEKLAHKNLQQLPTPVQ